MTTTADSNLKSELKVEEDSARGRRALSVSLTAERPDGRVAAVAAGARDIHALLTDEQEWLIEERAGTFVNLATLTMLPAVSAIRWPTFAVPRPDGPAPTRAAQRPVGTFRRGEFANILERQRLSGTTAFPSWAADQTRAVAHSNRSRARARCTWKRRSDHAETGKSIDIMWGDPRSTPGGLCSILSGEHAPEPGWAQRRA